MRKGEEKNNWTFQKDTGRKINWRKLSSVNSMGNVAEEERKEGTRGQNEKKNKSREKSFERRKKLIIRETKKSNKGIEETKLGKAGGRKGGRVGVAGGKKGDKWREMS